MCSQTCQIVQDTKSNLWKSFLTWIQTQGLANTGLSKKIWIQQEDTQYPSMKTVVAGHLASQQKELPLNEKFQGQALITTFPSLEKESDTWWLHNFKYPIS